MILPRLLQILYMSILQWLLSSSFLQTGSLAFTVPSLRILQHGGRGSTNFSSSSGLFATLSPELVDLKRQFDETTMLYQTNAQSTISITELENQIADLERETSNTDFWNESNAVRATHVQATLSQKTRLLSRLRQWEQWYGDAQAALEILQDENDSAVLTKAEIDGLQSELSTTLDLLQTDCEAASLEWLLNGPYDDCPARILITAGAGGTEATDWVNDLYRLYERYCRKRFTSVQLVDCVTADQGYKSVELQVVGPHAYGWLKAERGSHRLVRISPFNAQKKRQTTFAAVDVAPNVDFDITDIDLPDSDLEFSTMRASGKGGQNVNKVNSAVRLKHLPSGIVVRCDQERSQLQNRKIALNRIKAQLLALQQEANLEQIQQIKGDMIQASFGNSIRNYVLDPYQLIKDPRTGWETANIQAYLDGDVALLDDCIGTYLRHKAKSASSDDA